mmetsp:Transcript_13541/g.44209  ORF Transcript_13541/g.44209 Transcript_13541/m.44209 type:complete len:254 (+) Transcript_13541:397-1158(+)
MVYSRQLSPAVASLPSGCPFFSCPTWSYSRSCLSWAPPRPRASPFSCLRVPSSRCRSAPSLRSPRREEPSPRLRHRRRPLHRRPPRRHPSHLPRRCSATSPQPRLCAPPAPPQPSGHRPCCQLPRCATHFFSARRLPALSAAPPSSPSPFRRSSTLSSRARSSRTPPPRPSPPPPGCPTKQWCGDTWCRAAPRCRPRGMCSSPCSAPLRCRSGSACTRSASCSCRRFPRSAAPSPPPRSAGSSARPWRRARSG